MIWLAYAALLAVLVACYYVLFVSGHGTGVDFACFRAASIVAAHGGNPYDFAQLWRAEDALYNAPLHLVRGDPSYYYLDRYYNPPLFATALRPLISLPFEMGYAVYSAMVIGLAVAGSWLLLGALGWTRRRLTAVALVVVSPFAALTIWSGQQSTVLLFALGAALYALRYGRAGLAGALMALGWVKPHLLVPIALAVPLLLTSRHALIRWYAGFGVATLGGIALTVLTTGAGSVAAWLHTLFGYTGYADAIQAYMPSLSGMTLILLPHPWNKLIAMALMAVGLGVMGATIARVRRRGEEPWTGIGVLVVAWLLFAPFAHTNDDVLLLLPLAVAWKQGRVLPVLALWACTALPLAFLLPRPFSLAGIIPVALVFAAVLRSGGFRAASFAQLSVRRTAVRWPRVTGISSWLRVGLVLCALTLIGVTTLVVRLQRPAIPSEDAAMLLRYAANLGHGHGIVWNIGDHPVDGATDFLYMVVLAIWVHLGAGVELAARITTAASYLLTGLVIYLATRRTGRIVPFLAPLTAAYLYLGTGTSYVAVGFGAPIFALCVCLSWQAAHLVAWEGYTRRRGIAFATACLVMALVRPEGAFLALFMLGAILACGTAGQRRQMLAPFCAIVVGLGLAYFAWHWAYFGHPLPNPFYRKGGGHLHWSALHDAIQNTLVLLCPLLPVYAVGLVVPRARRYTVYSLLPLVAFVLLWVLMSNEMNFEMRFQYATVPLALLAVPRIGERIWCGIVGRPAETLTPRWRLWARVTFAGAGFIALLYSADLGQPYWARNDGLRDVGRALAPFARRHYTVAVSEAGLLPLYSGWRAIDVWGLNDAWIAQHALITPGYLARQHPALIMVNAFMPDPHPVDPYQQAAMLETDRVVLTYARRHTYCVAATYRHPGGTHYYYLLRSLPAERAIARAIRAVPYSIDDRRVPLIHTQPWCP